MVLCYILGCGGVLSGVEQELDLTCIKGNNTTLLDINVRCGFEYKMSDALHGIIQTDKLKLLKLHSKNL